MRSQKAVMLVACWGLLIYSAGAVAQTNPTAAAQGESAAPPGDDQAAGADTGLAEVVVTIQRFQEASQRAAALITNVTGPELQAAGIDDIRALQVLLTDSSFERQNDFTQLFIRGIGQKQDSDYIDSGTAMYFNNMYVSRAFAATLGFFDINSVQVLPGPQGTLYGRNALGGAVQINANKPTQTFEASATLDAGNYSSFHETGVVNVPLTDSLSVRAAVDSDKHDGYLSDGSDGLRALSGRLSALYAPMDSLTIYLWSSIYNDVSTAENTVLYPFGPHPWSEPSPGETYYAPGGPGTLEQTGVAAGGKVDFDFDGLTLTYIPTWFHYNSDINVWVEQFPALELNREHQYTQELSLANNNNERLKWIAGLYYYNFYTYQSELGVEPTAQEKGYAAYANATYSVLDWFRVTGGLRYSVDRKQGYGINTGLVGDQSFDFEHTWRQPDWKIGVEADVAPQSMVYAALQTGYMEGTFAAAPNTPTYSNLVEPEKILAFTVGSKNRFFDNHLELNDEAFYYDLKDLQITQLDETTGQTLLANAPKVRIWGDEIKLTALVTAADQITAGVGYLNARYTDFSPAGLDAADPDAITSLDGEQLVYAPSVSVNAGLQHIWNIAAGRLIGNVSTHYISGYWGTVQHSPNTYQGAFTKTDLSLTYYAADDRWNIGLWGKNLENSSVWSSGGTLGPSEAFAFIEPPRTFGIRVGAKIGGGR
jgi:iron complex outermembrane recepter protein